MRPFSCQSLTRRLSCFLSQSLLGGISFWLTIFLIPCGIGGQNVFAQAVQPGIELNQPANGYSNSLDLFRQKNGPVVGLYDSEFAAKGDLSLYKDGIRHWEYFLAGLEIPYILLSDSIFTASQVDSLEYIIVQSAHAVPDASLELLQQFVANGGGLIAFNDNKLNKPRYGKERSAFLREVLGIEEIIPLVQPGYKVGHRFNGGDPILDGIPLGFELDFLAGRSLFAAVPGQGKAVGYATSDGFVTQSTFFVTHKYKQGNVLWMGVSPIDIPPNEEQQRMYQRLIINTMVHVTNSAYVGVRRWPAGYSTAASFVQLPSSGYQPFAYRTSTDLLLSTLEETNVRGTFFVVSSHVKDHPDILARFTKQGVLGLVSDSPKPLKGFTQELQYQRLSTSKRYLESRSGVQVNGVLPPGFLYDYNTLRVLADLKAGYILSDARLYQEPLFLEWSDQLDYRDELVRTIIGQDSLKHNSTLAQDLPIPLVQIFPTTFSYDLSAPLVDAERNSMEDASIEERWLYRLEDSFDSVYSFGGLFVFAFEPESMGLSVQRANVLRSFVEQVKKTSTWIATLDDIVNWWRLRSSVEVSLESSSEQGAVLTINNKGTQEIKGISLDVYLPEIEFEHVDFRTSSLDVRVTERNDSYLVIDLNKLEPGLHYLEWDVVAEKRAEHIEQ